MIDLSKKIFKLINSMTERIDLYFFSIIKKIFFQVNILLNIWADTFFLIIDLSFHSCYNHIHLMIVSLSVFE